MYYAPTQQVIYQFHLLSVHITVQTSLMNSDTPFQAPLMHKNYDVLSIHIFTTLLSYFI